MRSDGGMYGATAYLNPVKGMCTMAPHTAQLACEIQKEAFMTSVLRSAKCCFLAEVTIWTISSRRKIPPPSPADNLFQVSLAVYILPDNVRPLL